MEKDIASEEDMIELISFGNSVRTTHKTAMNEESSRSHAICQICLYEGPRGRGRLKGKLSLIDLAGSERGVDTKSHNRQRRVEGAEINKSLLALKEYVEQEGTGRERGRETQREWENNITRERERGCKRVRGSEGGIGTRRRAVCMEYA